MPLFPAFGRSWWISMSSGAAWSTKWVLEHPDLNRLSQSVNGWMGKWVKIVPGFKYFQRDLICACHTEHMKLWDSPESVSSPCYYPHSRIFEYLKVKQQPAYRIYKTPVEKNLRDNWHPSVCSNTILNAQGMFILSNRKEKFCFYPLENTFIFYI